MEMITSRTNNKILKVISLYDEENIVNEGMFINEGLINLKEALKWGEVKEIYITNKYKDELMGLDIPTYLVSDDVLKKMSKLKNPNGIIFVSKIPSFTTKQHKKIIYLDDVQDPGNVGTIIRTALAFNYDMVVLSKDSASIFNPKVLSSCRGSIYKIPVLKMDFNDLKEKYNNHQIVVTTLDYDSEDLSSAKIEDKFILVFGNEGHGVNKNISDICNKKIKINMNEIDSLNVAVSSGIILYYLSK